MPCICNSLRTRCTPDGSPLHVNLSMRLLKISTAVQSVGRWVPGHRRLKYEAFNILLCFLSHTRIHPHNINAI